MTFDVAIVQFKPRKGDVGANFATLRGVFAQLLAAPASVPELIVLPEAAMTGYFLEGAVYELSFTAAAFAAKLDAEWRAAGGTAAIDIVCGFYENNDGTYHNSALYATIGGTAPRIVHVHRKMFLPTYGVFDEERFLSRGRALDVFPTPFGTAAEGRARDHHPERVARARFGGRRDARERRALARDGDADGERTRCLRPLRGLDGLRGRQGYVGQLRDRLAPRRVAGIAR
jgi:hypothetical protein